MVSSKLKHLKIRDITEFRLLKAMTPFLTHQIEPSEKCGCSNKVHMLSDEGSIMQQQQWRHHRGHDHYQLPDTVEAFLDEYCFSSAIDNQQSVPQNPKLQGDVLGMTPVTYAAISGNTRVLAQLLATPGVEASPRVRQTLRSLQYVVVARGSTPLLLASEYNYDKGPKVLALLMAHGADPHETDCMNHGAVTRMAAIDAGANIRWLRQTIGDSVSIDSSGKEIGPLVEAMCSNHLSAIEALLDLGARCRHDTVGPVGFSPLMVSGVGGDPTIVRRMLSLVGREHIDMRAVSQSHPLAALGLWNRLCWRAAGPCCSISTLAMASLAGATALHAAVLYANVDALTLLLEDGGADPLIRNVLGMTPLDLLRNLGGCKLMERVLLAHMPSGCATTKERARSPRKWKWKLGSPRSGSRNATGKSIAKVHCCC
jgi:hypothetical protein